MNDVLRKKQRDFISACLDATGLDPTSLARKAGLVPSTVNRFINSDKVKHLLSSRTIAALESASGVHMAASGAVALDPDVPPPSASLKTVIPTGAIADIDGREVAVIPRFDAAFSAGHGSLIDPCAEPLGIMLFELQWLRAVTRTAPNNLAVVRVDGDSMRDTLVDGDWIMIDRSQNRVNREGIYALAVDDACWVKRISVNLRDKLVKVISDNPAYDLQELPEENLTIIGRVVWIVGRKV